MRTYRNTQVFSDCGKNIVHGDIFFYKLDSSVSSLVRGNDTCFLEFIRDFSEKWLFDSELLTYDAYRMSSGIMREIFYQEKSILPRGRDFEHGKRVTRSIS